MAIEARRVLGRSMPKNIRLAMTEMTNRNRRILRHFIFAS